MKIDMVEPLSIPDLKVIRFTRYIDHRGYFTESYRSTNFLHHPKTKFLKNVRFVQINESFSEAFVVRGLHFQWEPYVGKLVRAIRGKVIDLALDIRPNSPTLGKIITRDISEIPEADYGEWIWVPPGFAHGFFCTTDCILEYLCSAEYNPSNEAGISPIASDIDWSLCDPEHKRMFDIIVESKVIISEKDKEAGSLHDWLVDERSINFNFDSRPHP